MQIAFPASRSNTGRRVIDCSSVRFSADAQWRQWLSPDTSFHPAAPFPRTTSHPARPGCGATDVRLLVAGMRPQAAKRASCLRREVRARPAWRSSISSTAPSNMPASRSTLRTWRRPPAATPHLRGRARPAARFSCCRRPATNTPATTPARTRRDDKCRCSTPSTARARRSVTCGAELAYAPADPQTGPP